jgi:putative ABC transport system ATP-binding protein
MADIRISGLEFRYPGSQAFGMSVSDLRVASGERLAIVGPSGSGKTTLLSLMAGIQVPQKGEIRVGDTTVNLLNEPERRAFRIQRVGQVFQAFELLDYLTVTENVLLGSIIDPAVVTGARERAADLLASVGLSHRAHAKPARLSHGERQRVAVCRAMLNDPELLLADEPTGNLDQANKQTVVDLLIEQARQHGSTLLMVTHDNSLLSSFERVIDFEELIGAGS